MTEKLFVSSSPHFRGKDSTARIMSDVLIALVPVIIASTIIFGFRVLLIVSFCVSSCVFLEFICRRIMKRYMSIGDLSAPVTGALLALSLPVNISLFLAFFGCVVAIVVAKQFFGGIGQNFINPAIAGRVAMVVSFPTHMTDWSWAGETVDAVTTGTVVDAVTTATPLAGGEWTYLDLFLGFVRGSIGETCAAAILIGFMYLLVRRVIKPIIPLYFVGTVAVFAFLFGENIPFHILSGGLLFVAVFMATDYSTSPLSSKGKVFFGIGCGIITVIIRVFGALPEGVSFAILLMNILTPHIDRLTVPKTFGTKRRTGKKI
ncbi:MAG: Na+-transporting NADH:ubiquinone oxidoreductase subunit D [Firmicutes bacterium HGW-Firmicutes-21]|nr:MAG: Na+-transporting NADH:ubiquinone oxidoreductase subunit D [Firmicutes bacterium HGW-Firmicutes-21]